MAAPNDPRTLLIPDNWPKSYLNDKWIPLFGGFAAFVGVGMDNYGKGKPFFSGIPKHIGFTALAIVVGSFLQERRRAYLADRDAVFRHYIELHPDDFPIPDRKYLKDVFKEWHPVR